MAQWLSRLRGISLKLIGRLQLRPYREMAGELITLRLAGLRSSTYV
jgi:hypothetical protein